MKFPIAINDEKMNQEEAIQDPQSTLILLLGIWRYLRPRRRAQLALLMVVMFASGGAELVSLGAVLPFLAVLSNPELLWQQPWIQFFATPLGLAGANNLLLPATFVFAVAATIAAFIRIANLWLNVRLAAAIGSDLSCEFYRRTLYQAYGVHLQRNSSEVITVITSQIDQTVGALNAFLQIVTSAVVAASLVTGLLLIDASVALAATVLFVSAYGVFVITVRRELHSNGHSIAVATNLQVKALQEGLGAIRDVLLDSSQPTYLEIYRQADRPQRQLQAKNALLGAFPRYALEALGMVAIALLGGLLVFQRGSASSVIPLLGALALGAQRLLPALQQIYNGWASLRVYNASIQAVLDIINQPLPTIVIGAEPLHLNQGISLEEVHFRYDSDESDVLKGLNFQIRRGERIGLIGSTGSGKSTTVDLLMGLLEPTAGRLLVDGDDLHDPEHPERLAAWRAAIAHVPQSIYLADSSIAENIAFGVPHHEIDLIRVKQAAQQAQISSFIDSCPDGYKTFVGERGIRLSGGQRQRIGIARALYKKARFLVFDEATSALDNSTEASVMKALEDLSQSLTVVIIAHRLSTISHCDRVIELNNGSIARETTGAVAAGFL